MVVTISDIAGKLGGGKVWQICSFQAFDEKILANYKIRQRVINCKYYFGWFSLANHGRFPKFAKLPPPNFSINGTSMALPHNNYV